ncbi:hypothetical protein DZA28_27675 [Pseudomonas alloputida]|uniref:Uncharacterized protein n=1 Tax=Pseudomonas alloputida TaxID=1940621 RepID=A0ABY3DD18_9PSED|nr:hypothetical protein DZA28_27675 [Pseudomonas alloputida]
MVPGVDEIPETEEERLKPDGDADALPVGAGVLAKQATPCMAPVSPVFAGMPAPTSYVLMLNAVHGTAKPAHAAGSRLRAPCSPHPRPCPG